MASQETASMSAAPSYSDLTKVCNFRATPAARDSVAIRCVEAETALATMEAPARLHLIRDTRPLHLALFGGFAPVMWPDAAGTYRGTPGTSIASAPRAVFLARKVPGLRSRDLCLSAADVPGAMEALSDRLRRLWDDRPGYDTPFRDPAYLALSDTTARFFAIHPYMDGNGHVWRLLLPVLANRLGLATRAEWTTDRRPYGPEFSLALQWHGDHPTLLADQLRRWLAPSHD